MNEKFRERLNEYLDSECSDYGMSYTIEFNEDGNIFEAEIKSDHNDNSKTLTFKYDEEENDLLIELNEDSFYETREFDETVKYFWMLVTPALFPEN